MTTPLTAAEVRKGARTRWTVTGIFVALVILLGSFFAYERIEQSRACNTGLEVRQANEEIDRRLWGEAADALEASPEQKAEFLAFIGEQYDELPPPAAC